MAKPTPEEIIAAQAPLRALVETWREEAKHSRHSEEKFSPDSAFGAWHCAAREAGTRHADQLEQALAAEAQVLSVILDELVSLDDMHCDERGPYYVMTAEERITWARLPEAHRDAIDHRVGKKDWRGFAAEVDELEAVMAANGGK